MRHRSREDDGLAIGFISLADLFFVGCVVCFLHAKSSNEVVRRTQATLESKDALLTRLGRETAQVRRGCRRSATESQLAVALPDLPLASDSGDVPSEGIVVREAAVVLRAFQEELERLRQLNTQQQQRIAAMEATNRDMAGLSQRYATELKAVRRALYKLRWELVWLTAEKRGYELTAHYLYVAAAAMRSKIERYVREIAAFESKAGEAGNKIATLEEALRRRALLPKELVGVRGNLQRVAFVVDCSASMNKVAPIAVDPSRDKRESWWGVVAETIELWIEALPMQSARIVYFNDSVSMFPATDEFLDIEVNRNSLRQSVKEHPGPHGATNTLLALQAAFAMKDVDTIVLFTDGEPNRTPVALPAGAMRNKDKTSMAYAKEFSTACWNQIFEFVEGEKVKGRNVRVNVVALGNYFDSIYGPSLVRLATMTGGAFLGRGGTQPASAVAE
jgi:VWA domain-containing protein